MDYEEAKAESFATANVIFDGDEDGGMSTRTYGICGKEALFIRITKSYLSANPQGHGPPGIVEFVSAETSIIYCISTSQTKYL